MDNTKMILEQLEKLNKKIDILQVEMKEEIKGIRSNLSEVRQICRGIEEKSQFWGALKEQVDIPLYNNESCCS